MPTTKIPLKDGYFEIALPMRFFEDNSKATAEHIPGSV